MPPHPTSSSKFPGPLGLFVVIPPLSTNSPRSHVSFLSRASTKLQRREIMNFCTCSATVALN